MGKGPVIDWVQLRVSAVEAARHSHCPHSGLSVGAAGLVDDDRVVSGCNVESASYGLTLCAECSLISDLHRTGGGRLIAVVTVDGAGNYLTPCGRCRQWLYEAGGNDCAVNEYWTVERLLPDAFGSDDLPPRPS